MVMKVFTFTGVNAREHEQIVNYQQFKKQTTDKIPPPFIKIMPFHIYRSLTLKIRLTFF